MRITCPNCSAYFEIPQQLLGRKGRSLKCATCGHSWFQAATIDEIDMAEILGNDQKANQPSDFGGPGGQAQGAAAGKTANEAWQTGVAAGPGSPKPPGGQQNPQPSGVQPDGQSGQFTPPRPTPPPLPPGARSMMSRRGGQPQQQVPPQQAGGMDSPYSWGNQPSAAGAGQAYGQNPGMAQAPGAPGGGPAYSYQQAPGGGAAMAPGGGYQQLSGGVAPGQMPGQPGQSMRGHVGADAVGDGTVSWLDKGNQQPGMMGPAQSQLGAGLAAPGQGARSLLSGQEVSGPIGAAQSQLGGGIEAPGQGARSLLSGQEVGGTPGHSMVDNGAPNMGARGPSMMGGPGVGEDGQTVVLEDDGTLGVIGGPGGSAPVDPAVDSEAEIDDLDSTEPEDLNDGVSGGPGGGEDEDDLVDPDEDRPDFGGSEDEDLGDEEAEDDEEEFVHRPAHFVKRPQEPEKKVDPVYMTSGILAAVALSLIAAVWFGRDFIPGMDRIYEALGIEDESPSKGLILSAPQARRIMVAGVQTLVVSGFVTNNTTDVKDVPNLRLSLLNEGNEVVQETVGMPSAPVVDPGSTVPYQIELQLPVETARNLRVDWE